MIVLIGLRDLIYLAVAKMWLLAQDFPYSELQQEISSSILALQEGGVLEDIKAQHQPPPPGCLASTEFSETNQVPVRQLTSSHLVLYLLSCTLLRFVCLAELRLVTTFRVLGTLL